MSDAYEVNGLWRYPVESMAGEAVKAVAGVLIPLRPTQGASKHTPPNQEDTYSHDTAEDEGLNIRR